MLRSGPFSNTLDAKIYHEDMPSVIGFDFHGDTIDGANV